MKCRGVCRHRLATLRARSRARVKVTEAVQKGDVWLLELECGHKTQRKVERKVYEPYPVIHPRRFVYCVECPLAKPMALFEDFDRRLEEWVRDRK